MNRVYLLLLLCVESVVTSPVPATDYSEDVGVMKEVLKYCDLYGYHDGSEIESMSKEELKSEIVEPIKQLKSFYRMKQINEEITEELLNLVRSPRCGKSDFESHRTKRWSRLSYRRWTKYPVTIKFNNFLTTRNISSVNQENLLLDCLQMWGDASGLWFRYRRPNDRGRTNIRIYFTQIDGPWKTVGIGKAPSSRGSHLKLDKVEEWKETFKHPGRGPSLRWAFCHELGHNLGLGHSSYKKSMMYSVGTNMIDDRLSYDDLNGIRAIYGHNNNKHAVEGALLVPPRQDTLSKARRTTRRPNITRRPSTRRTTTRRPTSRRTTTRQPTSRRTKGPITRQTTNRRPLMCRTTRRPTTPRTTRRPTSRRTRRPITRQTTTRRPVTRRTTRRPLTRRTTRRPTIRRTTRRPTFRRATIKRPAFHRTTRRPITRRTTPRHPITRRTRRLTTSRVQTTQIYTTRKVDATLRPPKQLKHKQVGMSFAEWWKLHRG